MTLHCSAEGKPASPGGIGIAENDNAAGMRAKNIAVRPGQLPNALSSEALYCYVTQLNLVHLHLMTDAWQSWLDVCFAAIAKLL